MNQHQTERVRSYLRGRLQLAILPVGGGVGGFIVAPLGQATGSGDYYPTLEELAARHGVAIPESIMHGPLDNHEQPHKYQHLRESEQARKHHEYSPMQDGYCSLCGWKRGEFCFARSTVPIDEQKRQPTWEEQQQIDEMGRYGDFYALSEYLAERGLGAPPDAPTVATPKAPATVERVGTKPMPVHKSVIIQFLLTHPTEREQVIPGWTGTIEEYIAELERRPEQFFVNGELIEEGSK